MIKNIRVLILLYILLIQITRIVFYSATIPQFADHLQVKISALFQAFGFQMLPNLLEIIDLLYQIILYVLDGICKTSGEVTNIFAG